MTWEDALGLFRSLRDETGALVTGADLHEWCWSIHEEWTLSGGPDLTAGLVARSVPPEVEMTDEHREALLVLFVGLCIDRDSSLEERLRHFNAH